VAKRKRKRKRGRPIGAKTAKRSTSIVEPSYCTNKLEDGRLCYATDRINYQGKPEEIKVEKSFTRTGRPFNIVQIRKTECAFCGEKREDVVRLYNRTV